MGLRKAFLILGLLILGIAAPWSLMDSTMGSTAARSAHLTALQSYLRDHTNQGISFTEKTPDHTQNPLLRKLFAKLRPVENSDVVPKFTFDQRVVQTQTLLERIYSPDFQKQMEDHYNGQVAPHERAMNSPYQRANQQWEEQQFQSGSHDMAVWTTRAALDNQIKELLQGADRDSGAIRFMDAMKKIGEDDPPPAKNKVASRSSTADGASSAQNDAAPAIHGTSTAAAPAGAKAKEQVASTPAKPQEEEIPTRVKAKLNVLQGQGQIKFTNPVALTTLHVDMKALTSGMNQSQMNTMTTGDDPIRVDMKREFKSVDVSSGATYGFEKRVVSFDVTKKVTDNISCVASSDQFTGPQRAADGSKSQQALRMTYSLSF